MVRTAVLRTEPDLALRLTVDSDGHRTVLRGTRLPNAGDTCSTSDVRPAQVDCATWALTPLQ